ncbi:MAG: hypothetical protein ACE5OT_01745 [Candidatus Hadarchaeaceae archaeon]
MELVEALEQGYPKKYAPANLNEVISRIIQSVTPAIAKAAEGTESRDVATVWEEIRSDERIRGAFAMATKIDMAVAIYVASKFENNRYVGSSLVQAALAEARR